MLGFLGLTADILGFEFDKATIIISLTIGVVVQLLRDAEPTPDGKARDISKQRQFS